MNVLRPRGIPDQRVILVQTSYVGPNPLLPLTRLIIYFERQIDMAENGVPWAHDHERHARRIHNSLKLEQGLGLARRVLRSQPL